MRWWIANKAHSAELAITISYLTTARGIIVLLKNKSKEKYQSRLQSSDTHCAPNILAVNGIRLCRPLPVNQLKLRIRNNTRASFVNKVGYWSEILALQTQCPEVRTKTTEGQYFPIRSRKSEVSKQLSICTVN